MSRLLRLTLFGFRNSCLVFLYSSATEFFVMFYCLVHIPFSKVRFTPIKCHSSSFDSLPVYSIFPFVSSTISLKPITSRFRCFYLTSVSYYHIHMICSIQTRGWIERFFSVFASFDDLQFSPAGTPLWFALFYFKFIFPNFSRYRL